MRAKGIMFCDINPLDYWTRIQFTFKDGLGYNKTL